MLNVSHTVWETVFLVDSVLNLCEHQIHSSSPIITSLTADALNLFFLSGGSKDCNTSSISVTSFLVNELLLLLVEQPFHIYKHYL